MGDDVIADYLLIDKSAKLRIKRLLVVVTQYSPHSGLTYVAFRFSAFCCRLFARNLCINYASLPHQTGVI